MNVIGSLLFTVTLVFAAGAAAITPVGAQTLPAAAAAAAASAR